MPITHLELKTFLLANLSDYLGDYVHAAGSTEKAIALLPHPDYGYYFPPDNWRVSGLEAVIIQPTRNQDNTRQLIAGDVHFADNWKIALKQHEQYGQMQEAMNVLAIAVTQIYSFQMNGYVPPNKGKGIVASTMMTIFDHQTITV